MLRRQSVIALGVAIVLGLVAVFLVNTFLSASERRQDAGQLTRVAVAAVPIGFGAEITPDKIRFAQYPASSLPPGSYTSTAQLLVDGKRRIALIPIGVNEPILANKISGEGHASIAALLPDGMRAASVRINDVSGVAGFIQPNDSVDVLITRGVAGGERGQQATDMLLQNVRVIAIGQNATGADGKPISARNATLEVDPIGAQKLALAQEVGSLSLVLRKPGDAQNSAVIDTVSLNDLRYGITGSARYVRPVKVSYPGRTQMAQASPAPAPRPVQTARPAPQRPRASNVEVVRGTQGNNYEVGNYGS